MLARTKGLSSNTAPVTVQNHPMNNVYTYSGSMLGDIPIKGVLYGQIPATFQDGKAPVTVHIFRFIEDTRCVKTKITLVNPLIAGEKSYYEGTLDDKNKLLNGQCNNFPLIGIATGQVINGKFTGVVKDTDGSENKYVDNQLVTGTINIFHQPETKTRPEVVKVFLPTQKPTIVHETVSRATNMIQMQRSNTKDERLNVTKHNPIALDGYTSYIIDRTAEGEKTTAYYLSPNLDQTYVGTVSNGVRKNGLLKALVTERTHDRNVSYLVTISIKNGRQMLHSKIPCSEKQELFVNFPPELANEFPERVRQYFDKPIEQKEEISQGFSI